MQQKFLAYLEKQDLITIGDRVLLAVSGGVDSMVLASLFAQSDIPVAIAHCNFKLRGEESDLDEELVAEFADENDLEFHSTSFDVKKAQENWGTGIQEAARRLRYEWFEKLCTTFGHTKIATAHHQDDLVETFLFNLIRGGGYKAWSSMQPKNGIIIRPLLWAEKKEIRGFAEQQKVPFREDASNVQNKYSRNQIRNEVIPKLEETKPGAARHIAEAAAHFSELEPFIEEHLSKLTQTLVEKDSGKWIVDLEKWKSVREKNTLLKFWSENWGLLPSQIAQVIDLESSQPGKFVETSKGKIYRERQSLIFVPYEKSKIKSVLIQKNVNQLTNPIPLEIQKCEVPQNFKDISEDEVFLDLEKLTFPLLLRPWKEGDKFQPLGMKGKQKISDFLIQQKVPLFEKENILVIESAGKIAWIVGRRMDHRFRISEKTETVLHLKLK